MSRALLRLDAWAAEGNLTWYSSTKTLTLSEDHAKNEPVRKFKEIMSSVIEGWTMVIPFGEGVTSNGAGTSRA